MPALDCTQTKYRIWLNLFKLWSSSWLTWCPSRLERIYNELAEANHSRRCGAIHVCEVWFATCASKGAVPTGRNLTWKGCAHLRQVIDRRMGGLPASWNQKIAEQQCYFQGRQVVISEKRLRKSKRSWGSTTGKSAGFAAARSIYRLVWGKVVWHG